MLDQYKIDPSGHYWFTISKCPTMKNCGFIVAMVVVQFAYGGSNILIKIALERGLNQFVFIVYRHIIAMLLLAPLAYVLESVDETMTRYIAFGMQEGAPFAFVVGVRKIFLLSSLGTTIHLNVYYAGLAYTSPTVATALGNVIPSLTFLLAVLLRMEKVKIKSASGGAKVLGTVICIGGSLVFTFWRGGFQSKGFVDRPLINIHSTNASHGEFRHGNESWMKGSALFLVSYIAWSGWLILQATASKVYPAQLSLNVLICFIASLQSSVLALFFARNPLLWKLQWNVQLLTIIYSGVVLSALVYFLQTWCISNKGPVFAAMFTPLVLVLVAIFSAIVFAERLHLGSLVGAFLIILGLYLVFWGKSRVSFVSGNTEDRDDFPDDKKLVISMNNCILASDKSVKVEAIN